MKKRYWLFKRASTYYLEDSQTGKQTSLHTKNSREAQRLRDAKLDATQQPVFNLALAKTYFAAHDPKLVERCWADVMDQMVCRGGQSTQRRIRSALRGKAFNSIRHVKLIETTSDDLVLSKN